MNYHYRLYEGGKIRMQDNFEEGLADAVRQRSKLLSGAVDLDALARFWGVDIHYKDLGTVSGWFRVIAGKPLILVNKDEYRLRQRFTIAHEFGHFFLKHGERPRDTEEQLRLRDPVEMSANRFAAALLMPQTEVVKLFNARVPCDIMADYFQVTKQSMGYRLQNLGLKCGDGR